MMSAIHMKSPLLSIERPAKGAAMNGLQPPSSRNPKKKYNTYLIPVSGAIKSESNRCW